jgi:glycosyltransferase involved in cell wall biosynthesis
MVGMADSIHFSRWLAQFSSSEHVFEVVSSSPHRKIHPDLGKMFLESKRFRIGWISRHLSLVMWIADRLLSDWVRGSYIFWRIWAFKPDIVHVHEIQNAGYATRRAYQLLGKLKPKPKLIVTNYGSDLVWFSKFPSHKQKLKSLLALADGYSAECKRDYILAEGLTSGYQSLPLMPTAGGLDKRTGAEKPRTIIAIKGYENHWGKAIVALEAIADLAGSLGALEIVLYSCNLPVIRKAKEISKNNGIAITTYKKGALSHQGVLDLFERSLVYVGHSLSDGISTSMLEAMAMGAIPIQTNTSCAEEWITDGETGFLITPEDSTALKAAVKSVLSGEFDVEAARRKNYEVIDDRYDPVKLQAVARTYYENIL